jgi:hypothetical protein
MATYAELVDRVISETMACQDPSTPQFKGRSHELYPPFGPHIAGGGGSYPTTDAAMSAIAELADRVRDNDPVLSRGTARDTVRLEASRAIGELLPELIAVADENQRWILVRVRLKARLQHLGQDIMHYVPVWLFLNQACPAFSIRPSQVRLAK